MRPIQGGRAKDRALPWWRAWVKNSPAIRLFDPVRRGGRFPRSRDPMEDIIKAAVLGIVEGLTEYVPVSSTGHLLLMQHFFGFGDEGFGNTFAVLIQFGAILALLSIHFGRA